ncbi:hypothetical protein GQX74_011488 [Glossina fuscipes]|uniref:Uncharacterized protein n=1 Tax=Glossina palpalis gambiensis TaxID=67801 RepID=A0A1B0AZX9_9MUSC|nr:hypothetical protein GQX74_011488 [Glossina fuscipes]
MFLAIPTPSSSRYTSAFVSGETNATETLSITSPHNSNCKKSFAAYADDADDDSDNCNANSLAFVIEHRSLLLNTHQIWLLDTSIASKIDDICHHYLTRKHRFRS